MQMKLYKQIKLFLLDNRVGYHVLNDKKRRLLIAAFDDPDLRKVDVELLWRVYLFRNTVLSNFPLFPLRLKIIW